MEDEHYANVESWLKGLNLGDLHLTGLIGRQERAKFIERVHELVRSGEMTTETASHTFGLMWDLSLTGLEYRVRIDCARKNLQGLQRTILSHSKTQSDE